ncbi:MAG: endonuclease/exonuclease/phosphatase family protein [Maribacter sp.]|uniref:endonuclease/exonuclease/phosphatase family protein n=1 Tax=Maribacter sp. TaxID=1897614 RepID=UPI0032970FC1
MKYKIIIALLFVFSLAVYGQETKVMTYNIKYDNVHDTVNNWNDRKLAMVNLLRKHHPQFIGMQEVLHRQLTYLNTALVDYAYIGVGRDDGAQKGEFSPILYDTTAYKLLKSNTFWLSKTPDKISVGWDAAMERICTYGYFQHKTSKKKLWVFNTHFDHIGQKARKKSAKLLLKKIKQLNTAKLPVVLMGDFNLIPEEKPILSIQKRMNDAQHSAKNPTKGPRGTFNGFDVNDPMERRIDYIFTEGLEIESYLHLDERLENGKHISDHLPVLITISKN